MQSCFGTVIEVRNTRRLEIADPEGAEEEDMDLVGLYGRALADYERIRSLEYEWLARRWAEMEFRVFCVQPRLY